MDWIACMEETLNFKVSTLQHVPLVATRLCGRAQALWQQLNVVLTAMASLGRSFKSIRRHCSYLIIMKDNLSFSTLAARPTICRWINNYILSTFSQNGVYWDRLSTCFAVYWGCDFLYKTSSICLIYLLILGSSVCYLGRETTCSSCHDHSTPTHIPLPNSARTQSG